MKMEKKVMERKLIENSIPVWEWNGIQLVRIGKDEFVTVEPVARNVRSFEHAKKVVKEFCKNNHCNATITFETEWFKLVEFLKINYATKQFLKKNNLISEEVLLLDSISEGETHVLAAGPSHCLNEIFRGFISGDDSDGEPQTSKMLFLTIKGIK